MRRSRALASALLLLAALAGSCIIQIEENRLFPCASDLDCAAGEGAPFGCYISYGTRFCARVCDFPGTSRDDCFCDPQQSLCLLPCTSHADCPIDASCVVSNAIEEDSHCQLRLLCELAQGTPAYDPEGMTPGAGTCERIDCNSSDDCWAQLDDVDDPRSVCIRDLRLDSVDPEEVSSVCVSLCQPDLGIDCAPGFGCARSSSVGDAGYCGPVCAPQPGLPAANIPREIGCPPGFRCTSEFSEGGEAVCVPAFLGFFCDPTIADYCAEGECVEIYAADATMMAGLPAEVNLCALECNPVSATPCPAGYSCMSNPVVTVDPMPQYICVPGIPIAPCEQDSDCTDEFYGEPVYCMPFLALGIYSLDLCAIACDPNGGAECPNTLLSMGIYDLECNATDAMAAPDFPGGCLPLDIP